MGLKRLDLGQLDAPLAQTALKVVAASDFAAVAAGAVLVVDKKCLLAHFLLLSFLATD